MPGVSTFAAFGLMRRRSSLNNFKLATVAKVLGLEFDEASMHDALYDIELTRELFYLLRDRVRKD